MTKLFLFLQTWVQSHEGEDEGATMVEYGIMVAGIAVLAIAAVFALGGAITGLFEDITNQL